MGLLRVLQYGKSLLSQAIEEGEIAIDATAGNGYDTLFLAQLVGDHGHVYAFDVQQQAIDSTEKKLAENQLLHRVSLILDGHEHLSNYVHEKIAGAMFNLGYLPGSDHQIMTKGNTTVQAIDQLLPLLKVGGRIVLIIYHGHVGGKEERDEVLQYIRQLPQKYVQVLRYEFMNQKNDPPFLIAIEKVKDFK